MHTDNMEEPLVMHQMERRARGPQLRLRFGKRADTNDQPETFQVVQARAPSLRLRFGKRTEDSPVVQARAPSLRLRFGKRTEESPISAYSSGISSEGDN
ncbi:hypothetical protein JTB14_019850 [Gonioctena quinquepunctata]|nr:hypothetical protein JTB14_019850 [Gonioctena quinquepunctata]